MTIRRQRMFPMLPRGSAPIPWEVAEAIYRTMYVPLYGDDQSLDSIAKRGGFGHGEIEAFADQMGRRLNSGEEEAR